MPGSFNPTQPSNRPGLYVRFQTKAAEALSTQEGDTLALPIKADWGPDGVVVPIRTERELNATFGQGQTAWQVADALRAGAGEVLAYRMADSAAAASGEALASGGGSGIAFTARYKGAFADGIAIKVDDYLPDPSKDVLRILASGAELEKYIFDNGDLAGVASTVDANSAYLGATSYGVPSAVLAHTTGALFTGGLSGGATLQTYQDAFSAFDGSGDFQVVAVESVATTVKEAFINWVRDNNDNGNYMHGVFGSDAVATTGVGLADAEVWAARAGSEHLDYAGAVNIIDRAAPDAARATQVYSMAEMAPRVAGLVANARIARGITFRSLGPETDVQFPLDEQELQEAQDNGILTVAKHIGTARVEHAITTFTDFTDVKDQTFAQIRAVRVMEQIGRDFEEIVGDDFIGVKNNTPETRNALIKALESYLSGLAAVNAILPGFVVELDPTQDSVSGQSIYLQVQLQFGKELLRVFLTLTAPTFIL